MTFWAKSLRVFNCVHDIVKSYALAIGQRLRQVQKDLQQAEAMFESHRGRSHAAGAGPEVKAQVEARQRTYRHHLETLSLTLHPFGIADSAPQTFAEVESYLQQGVEAWHA